MTHADALLAALRHDDTARPLRPSHRPLVALAHERLAAQCRRDAARTPVQR